VPTVTVSPEFQIIIPQEVREALDIQPGDQLEVFHHENRIELIPIRPIYEMRGFLRGIDTTIEPDR
jgi:AbrB family looped-hinge helix DNA binding protein